MFVVPAVVLALTLVALAARRRRVVVPQVAPISLRRASAPVATAPAIHPGHGQRMVANGTPPSTVIPLALRDDRNLVATPAVVIGLQRLKRGNAPRAASSGEINADPPPERADDTLPTIIVDEN